MKRNSIDVVYDLAGRMTDRIAPNNSITTRRYEDFTGPLPWPSPIKIDSQDQFLEPYTGSTIYEVSRATYKL